MQEEITNKKWIKDEDKTFDEAEQIQLDIGQNIEGILTEKFEFTGGFGKTNWGYVIKEKDCKKPKLLFGCTILNRKMADKPIGTEIMIERIKDVKTKNGTAHNFETYHKE